MDRMFVNGEKYRMEDPESGVVTTFKVEKDRLIVEEAEDGAGKPIELSSTQKAEAEASAAAAIKAGELRPLHEDER